METFRHSTYKFIGDESPPPSSSSSLSSSADPAAAADTVAVGGVRPQSRDVSVSLTDDATPTKNTCTSNGVDCQSSVTQGTLSRVCC